MVSETTVCRYCLAPFAAASGDVTSVAPGSVAEPLRYPETLWVLFSLVVAVGAAVVAFSQAADARAERRAAESLRRDISLVAANVTKMALVLADGSGRFGGPSDVHIAVIERYEEAIRAYLPPGLDAEIEKTLVELDGQIRRRNERG
jgi:hypothetical protein